MLSQHALQVVSQHALQQVSRGGCSGGVCSTGGVCSREVCSRACLVETPSGQLLLWAVRILLECILVFKKKTELFYWSYGYFCYRLLMPSGLNFKDRMDPLTCVIHHLYALNSPDSPLVRHLRPLPRHQK